MYFSSPQEKSNTDNFYNILTSLKKKDSIQPAIDYLKSINNEIILHEQINQKSTYAFKIYKLLNNRPEHFKEIILYFLESKNSYSEFQRYLSSVQFDPKGKHYQEFLNFSFYNEKCFEHTKHSSFWGNYLLDNFTLNNPFLQDIKKYLKTKEKIDFHSSRVFSKLEELYGTEHYDSLLIFLKEYNFDFSLKESKQREKYSSYNDKVYPNFHIPYLMNGDEQRKKQIISDYLSFFNLKEFPLTYQNAIFYDVLKNFAGYYTFKDNIEFFKIFFKQNSKISIYNEPYNTPLKENIASNFNFLLKNDIPFNLINEVTLEIYTKTYNNTTSSPSNKKLMHLLIDEFFDIHNYSINQDQFLQIVNKFEEFEKNTPYLLEKFITGEKLYFFPKIAEEKISIVNKIFNEDTNCASDFICLAKKYLKNNTRNNLFFQDFISKIDIINSEVNFKKVFDFPMEDSIKTSFFDFIFQNNEKLGHLLFNGFSESLIENHHLGIKNLSYYENFLNSKWFTDQEYINKNNALISSLLSLDYSHDYPIITEVKDKIIKKEKAIISNNINSNLDLSIHKKRL